MSGTFIHGHYQFPDSRAVIHHQDAPEIASMKKQYHAMAVGTCSLSNFTRLGVEIIPPNPPSGGFDEACFPRR